MSATLARRDDVLVFTGALDRAAVAALCPQARAQRTGVRGFDLTAVPRVDSAGLAMLAELAAVSTTLARLVAEYRRTVRRVRALQDVLLPELDTDISDIETRLEDLEREDALVARQHRQ